MDCGESKLKSQKSGNVVDYAKYHLLGEMDSRFNGKIIMGIIFIN